MTESTTPFAEPQGVPPYRLADEYDMSWYDRIPLIETICWDSKGWLDPELARKMEREDAPLMRKLGVKVSGGYVYVRQSRKRPIPV